MIVGIAILIATLGTVLIVLAARGRHLGDGETCRRCGYDLRGRPAGAAACPECGATLDAPRAIFRGTRRRRGRWIAVGVVALLLGGATIGLDRGGLLTARTLDRLTPTSYLLWRMDRDRGPTLTSTVWTLLGRQFREPGRVSDAQRRRVLARLVAIHGDASLPWVDPWNEVIETAFVDGTLPGGLTKAYVERLADAVSAEIGTTPLEVGGLLRPDLAIAPWRHRDLNGGTMFGGAGGTTQPMWATMNLQYVLRLDGEVIADSWPSMRDSDGFMFGLSKPGKLMPFSGDARVPRDFAQRHTLGPCGLEIEMRFDIVDANRRGRGTLGSAVRVVRLPVAVALPSAARPAE